MVLTMFIIALILGIIYLVGRFISSESKSINEESETDVDVLLRKREEAEKLNKDVDTSVTKIKQTISKIENKKQSHED